MPVYKYTTTMAECTRQTTRADNVLPCKLHWVGFASQNAWQLYVPFLYFYCLSHLSIYLPLPKHYFALILQYGVARCFFQRFLAKMRFWSFWPHSLQTPFSQNFNFWLCVLFAGLHHMYLWKKAEICQLNSIQKSQEKSNKN